VPEPYISEVAIGKLKRYKSPGADHIPAELIQVWGGGGGGYYILITKNILILSGTNKNCTTN
jgi:hypothetical protein